MFNTGIVQPTTGDQSSSNGFISSIAGAFQAGIEKIGSDVLPNWTAQQLGVQMNPVLDNPTITPSTQAVRADAVDEKQVTPALWDTVQKNLNVSSGAVLMIGVVLLGAVVAIKILR
ncbi:MAG: hypothetical protein PVG39_11360 [Desulfobacteraceae bacterium]|jgi:hypothetical protein